MTLIELKNDRKVLFERLAAFNSLPDWSDAEVAEAKSLMPAIGANSQATRSLKRHNRKG